MAALVFGRDISRRKICGSRGLKVPFPPIGFVVYVHGVSWNGGTTVDGRNSAPVDMVNIPLFIWF